ncbi:hypothetical protein FE257_003810 [Aspergillus nanangensis]|uniref:Rhodopsin domain-containing protein n=1 Tax=Aspergillus nanangensis TaxID=2582783 RepID=A0AAD4CB73_ASPNN|nr:hypothetical protein FE257_003810 [Aspergillus nanangensis]
MEADGPVPDRGPQLIVLLWVMTGLSTFTVLLRFTSRGLRGTFGWDDYMMLFTLVCFYGWTICITMLSLKGGQRHMEDVIPLGPDLVAQVNLLNWTGQVFGILGLGAGKISIAALLLGILSKTPGWRGHKLFLWIVCIILVVLTSIACASLSLSQCNPPAALWDSRIEGDCIDPQIMADYGTFTGSFNTFADASLSLVPSSIFFRLQMQALERVQLSTIFALNILTTICSAVKTSYLRQLANRSDFTWGTYNIFTWNTGELFVIIFCGTVPTLKPVLDMVLRWISRPTTAKDTGSWSGTGTGGWRASSSRREHSHKSREEEDTDTVGILLSEQQMGRDDQARQLSVRSGLSGRS